MTDQPTVLVDRRDGFHVVTLNRPQRLNAFTEEMHLALRAALEQAEGDDACGALLITGAGRAFCSGQDLTNRLPGSGPPRDLGASLDTFFNPLVRQLRALPFPVIAAVNGTAAGAGRRRAGAWARAHRRAAGGRDRGRMGPDLEGGRRRPADRRCRGAVRPVRNGAAAGLEPDQAGARRGRAERSRRPARLRARPAAQGGLPSGLCRGRARLPGEARAEFLRWARRIGPDPRLKDKSE